MINTTESNEKGLWWIKFFNLGMMAICEVSGGGGVVLSLLYFLVNLSDFLANLLEAPDFLRNMHLDPNILEAVLSVLQRFLTPQMICKRNKQEQDI